MWKEHDEDIQFDAGAYYERLQTDVSKGETSEQGYGAIPTYGKGDNVPCYWDRMRNWLIPVASAFEQFPTAGFASNERKDVPENTLAGTATYYTIIEVNRPGIDDIDQWAPVALSLIHI